jgi:hypothetical protein
MLSPHHVLDSKLDLCQISDSIFSSTSLHDACLVISIFSGKKSHDACLFAAAGGWGPEGGKKTKEGKQNFASQFGLRRATTKSNAFRHRWRRLLLSV